MQIRNYNFKSEVIRHTLYVFCVNLFWKLKLVKQKPDRDKASRSLPPMRGPVIKNVLITQSVIGTG
jgi:hypothetical protein